MLSLYCIDHQYDVGGMINLAKMFRINHMMLQQHPPDETTGGLLLLAWNSVVEKFND